MCPVVDHGGSAGLRWHPGVVILTIGLEELLAKAGLAETSDSSTLTSISCCGLLMRLRFGHHHQPPQHPPRLRKNPTDRHPRPNHGAHRDGGCSFPGCTHPPSYCDRHHQDWILGGLTDLDNLTLLCRYHHTHFLQKGWTCRINTDGLPEWIPPWWIDQHQRPQVNTRIRRLHAQHRRRPPAAAWASEWRRARPPQRSCGPSAEQLPRAGCGAGATTECLARRQG